MSSYKKECADSNPFEGVESDNEQDEEMISPTTFQREYDYWNPTFGTLEQALKLQREIQPLNIPDGYRARLARYSHLRGDWRGYPQQFDEDCQQEAVRRRRKEVGEVLLWAMIIVLMAGIVYVIWKNDTPVFQLKNPLRKMKPIGLKALFTKNT